MPSSDCAGTQAGAAFKAGIVAEQPNSSITLRTREWCCTETSLNSALPSESNGYAKKRSFPSPCRCHPVLGSCRLQQKRRRQRKQQWRPRVRKLAAIDLGPGQLESKELAVDGTCLRKSSRQAGVFLCKTIGEGSPCWPPFSCACSSRFSSRLIRSA